MEVILSIVGAFLSIGLMANAYFIKGLVDELTAVRIQIAAMDTTASYTVQRVTSLEAQTAGFYKRFFKLEQGQNK